MDLMEWFIDQSNSSGEDLNDGDIHPGWLTGNWVGESDIFEITYETPDNVETKQRFRITAVE